MLRLCLALVIHAMAVHTAIAQTGKTPVTPAVLKEIDLALKSHELIKIRALGDDRNRRKSLSGEICTALDASPVQQIGKILVIFRPKPELPDEANPAPRRGRKPKFRPKRSFQSR